MADDLKEANGFKEIEASEILATIEKGDPVHYEGYTVKGDLIISEIKLPKEGHKHIIYPSIVLKNSIIKGKLIFSNCIFENYITISNNHFEKFVTFEGSQFIKYADFSGSIFSEETFFREDHFEEAAIFDGSQFGGLTEFSYSKFNELTSFQRCKFCEFANFGLAFFRYVADFSGVQFVEVNFWRARFNVMANFSKAFFGRSANFWESQFKNGSTFRGAKFNSPSTQEIACRMAKNTHEKNGNKEEAGYHFYREMDAKRKQKPWYIRYPEFVFIQLIFGYGIHPFRLWACWFIFVGIFAAFYWFGQGIDPIASQLKGNATYVDYIWFSIATAVTPGYAGYKPTMDFKLVAGLEAILGTFMWAAFIATFARKYMR